MRFSATIDTAMLALSGFTYWQFIMAAQVMGKATGARCGAVFASAEPVMGEQIRWIFMMGGLLILYIFVLQVKGLSAAEIYTRVGAVSRVSFLTMLGLYIWASNVIQISEIPKRQPGGFSSI